MHKLIYDFSQLNFDEKTAISLIKKNNNAFTALENFLNELDPNAEPHLDLSNALQFIKDEMGGCYRISTNKNKKASVSISKRNAITDYKKSILFFSLDKLNELKDFYLGTDYFIKLSDKKVFKTLDEYLSLSEKDKKEYASFFELIYKALDYSRFNQIYYSIFQKFNINVCTYCLAQYALVYHSDKKKEWKLTAELEHLYPKSKFPLLSLSVNNIFPVCGHCNKKKLDSLIDYSPLNDEVKYKLKLDHMLNFNPQSGRIAVLNGENIKIEREPALVSQSMDKDLVEIMDYENLYENFRQFVGDFIERFNKYGSEGYGNSIKNIFKNEVVKLVEDRLIYFLTDTSLDEKDVFKYPLTKLKQEIYKEVKSKMLVVSKG